jgi:hypothetical protein
MRACDVFDREQRARTATADLIGMAACGLGARDARSGAQPGAIATASKAERLTPATVAGIVAFVLSLPDQASVPALLASPWRESRP